MNDQYISYEDYQRACELNDFDRNCTCGNNATREEMLSTLKSLKFSIIELGLYLDTHPDDEKAILNDIGTEELAHLEMVGTIIHQLTDGCCPEELKQAGLGSYYTDHGVCLEYILKEFNNNLN